MLSDLIKDECCPTEFNDKFTSRKSKSKQNLEKAVSEQTLTFTGSVCNFFLMWAGEVLLLLLLLSLLLVMKWKTTSLG